MVWLIGSRRSAWVLFGYLLVSSVSACSTQVQSTGTYVPRAEDANAPLPRPDMVVVYEFAVDPRLVQVDQGLASRLRESDISSQVAEQDRTASEVKEAISKTLLADIRGMGLPAQLAGAGPLPRGNVVIIRGQVTDIDLGNRTRRTVIGLGAGKSQVDANVELSYARGGSHPRLLQTYSAATNSGRAPGLGVGLGIGAASGTLTAGTAIVGVAGTAISERSRSESGHEAIRMAHRLGHNIGQFFADQSWIPASSVPKWMPF
jgi:uncharacterized protein DUF4410